MRGHGYARLLVEFSGVILSSRRTESRNLTGDGKVGGSYTAATADEATVRKKHFQRGEKEGFHIFCSST